MALRRRQVAVEALLVVAGVCVGIAASRRGSADAPSHTRVARHAQQPPSPAAPPAPRGPLRACSGRYSALAIDGSGAGALGAAQLLAELEARVNQLSPRGTAASIGDRFDVIVGASGGALSAALLAAGERASDVARMWADAPGAVCSRTLAYCTADDRAALASTCAPPVAQLSRLGCGGGSESAAAAPRANASAVGAAVPTPRCAGALARCAGGAPLIRHDGLLALTRGLAPPDGPAAGRGTLPNRTRGRLPASSATLAAAVGARRALALLASDARARETVAFSTLGWTSALARVETRPYNLAELLAGAMAAPLVFAPVEARGAPADGRPAGGQAGAGGAGVGAAAAGSAAGAASGACATTDGARGAPSVGLPAEKGRARSTPSAALAARGSGCAGVVPAPADVAPALVLADAAPAFPNSATLALELAQALASAREGSACALPAAQLVLVSIGSGAGAAAAGSAGAWAPSVARVLAPPGASESALRWLAALAGAGDPAVWHGGPDLRAAEAAGTLGTRAPAVDQRAAWGPLRLVFAPFTRAAPAATAAGPLGGGPALLSGAAAAGLDALVHLALAARYARAAPSSGSGEGDGGYWRIHLATPLARRLASAALCDAPVESLAAALAAARDAASAQATQLAVLASRLAPRALGAPAPAAGGASTAGGSDGAARAAADLAYCRRSGEAWKRLAAGAGSPGARAALGVESPRVDGMRAAVQPESAASAAWSRAASSHASQPPPPPPPRAPGAGAAPPPSFPPPWLFPAAAGRAAGGAAAGPGPV
ncbi:hypothetical protein KFE25_006653 [Diacronema lutheri]|uniref:PNPLA domain-containing protein n=1 Tax=Diacronema lutheri TaxID=2081491 RepID=A0A8J6CDY8_DIALT|nr:hypothetical protein KFE25_006653 [Diacronema lutheri]